MRGGGREPTGSIRCGRRLRPGHRPSGEADLSSIAQFNEVLTAQVSARTSHLTIDVTNLRSADPATAQALALAALIVRVQGGNAVLLNPRATVALTPDRLRAAETFTFPGPDIC